VPRSGVLSLRASTVLPSVRPVEASPPRHPCAVLVLRMSLLLANRVE